MELFSIRRITMIKETQETAFGYIDKEDCFYQLLCKSVYIFDFKLLWWSYFEEKVPNWAIFNYRCLGSADWKSVNPPLIDFHSQNPYIFRLDINKYGLNWLNSSDITYKWSKFDK